MLGFNFTSMHGKVVGLFRGLITPGDAVLGGDWNPAMGVGFHGVLWSTQDSITATASGTQATAYNLIAFLNRITTVGTAADSVALPVSEPGMTITIINDAASNATTVYGNYVEAATIDGVATGTGNTLAAGHRGEYVCVTKGKWQSYGSAKAA